MSDFFRRKVRFESARFVNWLIQTMKVPGGNIRDAAVTIICDNPKGRNVS